MNAAVQELLTMLGTVAEHHIVEVPTAALEAIVTRKLGRSPVLKGATNQDVVLAVVFEAALSGPGRSFTKPDDSLAHPILAAKHLFGLGEYPETGQVPDTTETLAFLRKKAGTRSNQQKDVAGPAAYSVRAQIAVYAGNLGEHRTGVGKARYGPLIAQYLLDQIEIELDSATLARRIAPRIADIAARRAKGRREVSERSARFKSRFDRRRWMWIAGAGFLAAAIAAVLVVPRFVPDPTIASDPETATADYWHSGWGPDRDTFAVASGGAPYPVFNSIIDNADYGDERNFLTIKSTGDNRGAGGWVDDVWANEGDEFAVRIYGENSGSDDAADVSAGSLQDARAAFFISEGDREFSIGGVLSAKNSTTVWDGVVIHTAPGMRLDWDRNSAQLITNASPNGVPLAADPFTVDGARLGFEEQDGIVKPGYKYSFYVIATLKVSKMDDRPATVVHTYMPSIVPNEAGDGDIVCGPISHLSPRADAVRCITGRLVLDPCFVSSVGSVACPGVLPNRVPVFDPTYPADRASTLSLTRETKPPAVTIEDAAADYLPWAVRLAETGESGNRWVCVAETASDVFSDHVKYVCNAVTLPVIHTAADLESSDHIAVAEYTEGSVFAGNLDRTNDIWTISMEDAASSSIRTVEITDAWF